MVASTSSPKRSYRMVARAEQAAATRQRILENAWRHFATRPYESVRLSDVAADASTTVQTLHQRFGTKDELFVAAWRDHMAGVGASRSTAAPGDVKNAIRVLYDSYEADGDAVLRLLAHEERIPAVHEMADQGRAGHRRWVERTLGDGADERRVIALIVATDLLTWKLLRREMRLPRGEAERIVADMVTATKGAR